MYPHPLVIDYLYTEVRAFKRYKCLILLDRLCVVQLKFFFNSNPYTRHQLSMIIYYTFFN